MYQPDLTQAEKNAMRRVSSGSVIDTNMWSDLAKKGMVERTPDGRILTDRGKMALATSR
jgi:ribosomal protein S19E (S16A)